MLALILLTATAHRDAFAQEIADRLRVDRQWLQKLRVEYEVEPRYLMSDDAYHFALSDLEDYQDGDPRITEERLLNDALEVEMDLAPYRDSTNVMR